MCHRPLNQALSVLYKCFITNLDSYHRENLDRNFYIILGRKYSINREAQYLDYATAMSRCHLLEGSISSAPKC